MKTLCALLLAASAAHGADFAAAFLRTGLGARGLGLGAFVAAADDASAPYWNPAGLARLRGKTLQTSIQSLSLGRRQGSAALAFNVRGDMGFGFAWSHAAVGGIKGRTASGQYTGPIEDQADAFILGIGRSLGPRFAVGLAVKVLRQGIRIPLAPSATANGSGFDLGVQFRVAEHTWLGAGASNFAAELAWKVRHADQRSNTTENGLPRTLVFGASHRLLDALLVAAELRTDGEQSVNLGAEWQLSALLVLRGGLHRLGVEDGGQLSVGLTLHPMHRETLQFQYAYLTDPLGAGGRTTVGLVLAF